jgi:hypothetical protein
LEEYRFKELGLNTIHVPGKYQSTMKEYENLPGQPALNSKEITEKTIETVCKLTSLVYKIQNKRPYYKPFKKLPFSSLIQWPRRDSNPSASRRIQNRPPGG